MRVVITPNTFCGECIYCKAGKPNICESKRSIGVNCDGGFAEEIIVNSRYVLHVPDEISAQAAVLIEPLSVVVHGMKKSGYFLWEKSACCWLWDRGFARYSAS